VGTAGMVVCGTAPGSTQIERPSTPCENG
jgi:hypothetical protein